MAVSIPQVAGLTLLLAGGTWTAVRLAERAKLAKMFKKELERDSWTGKVLFAEGATEVDKQAVMELQQRLLGKVSPFSTLSARKAFWEYKLAVRAELEPGVMEQMYNKLQELLAQLQKAVEEAVAGAAKALDDLMSLPLDTAFDISQAYAKYCAQEESWAALPLCAGAKVME